LIDDCVTDIMHLLYNILRKFADLWFENEHSVRYHAFSIL
jgi:hypothetical protein